MSRFRPPPAARTSARPGRAIHALRNRRRGIRQWMRRRAGAGWLDGRLGRWVDGWMGPAPTRRSIDKLRVAGRAFAQPRKPGGSSPAGAGFSRQQHRAAGHETGHTPTRTRGPLQAGTDRATSRGRLRTAEFALRTARRAHGERRPWRDRPCQNTPRRQHDLARQAAVGGSGARPGAERHRRAGPGRRQPGQGQVGNNNAYIVQMAEQPVTAYDGGIAGYKATTPGQGQKIDPNAPAVVSYGLPGDAPGHAAQQRRRRPQALQLRLRVQRLRGRADRAAQARSWPRPRRAVGHQGRGAPARHVVHAQPSSA